MNGIRTRLSVMMFLQFFIWGAWYTMIAVYMAKVGMERLTFWPFTVNPIAVHAEESRSGDGACAAPDAPSAAVPRRHLDT